VIVSHRPTRRRRFLWSLAALGIDILYVSAGAPADAATALRSALVVALPFA